MAKGDDKALLSGPFAVLSEEERLELRSAGESRVFKKGRWLFRSGDNVEGLFCILSGVVKITQCQSSREIVLRLASTGDWAGHRSIFTSDTYRGSARAKEDTRAFMVPTKTLLKFFGGNPEFANQLIRLISRDLENTERQLFEHQKLNVPSRLISLFRVLDQKFGEQSPEGRLLSAKLSKVELAQMVGASQEVVSRQLSKWKKENLLREKGKRIFLSNKLLERVIR